MKNIAAVIVLGSAAVLGVGALAATVTEPPPWAFPINPPATAPAKEDTSLKHVPGSTLALTIEQTTDGFNVPDWHPEEHPPMPDPVAHGHKPDYRGCGYCHLPNGLGRPENASIAGLPAEYIEHQVADFRSGDRKSSQPRMGPPANMIEIAKAAPSDDVKTAAEYFSNLHLKPWIHVVEASTVPVTHVAGSMLVVNEGGAKEPIGDRIIETPEDLGRTELRDAASGFIAYVPPGSIKKGEVLVNTGGGKATQCGVCHGADLKGLGPVPALAGRSPSYIIRQLIDIQNGTRHGSWSALMKPVVEKLTVSDMVAIAAYTASRNP